MTLLKGAPIRVFPFSLGNLFLFDNFSMLHNEVNILQNINVTQNISTDRNDICVFPDRNGACFFQTYSS